MAHADSLPDNILDTILEEVSNFLNATRDFFKGDIPTEMGETFSVWILDADKIEPTTTDLTRLARPLNRWHHQLKFGKKAVMFARSMPLEMKPSNWTVQELAESPIPDRIDRAIDWIDTYTENDPLVRILVVPAYHIYAFWLIDGDKSQLLMVDLPPNFTNLRTDRLYSSQNFFSGLFQEHPVMEISEEN